MYYSRFSQDSDLAPEFPSAEPQTKKNPHIDIVGSASEHNGPTSGRDGLSTSEIRQFSGHEGKRSSGGGRGEGGGRLQLWFQEPRTERMQNRL